MPSLSRRSGLEISGTRQRFSTVMCTVRLSALLKVVCLGVWCSVISVSALHAQAVYGSIGGVVLDSSGGAVTSAKITITDKDRGVVFTTQSDSSGRYDERHLIAGHYQVKIEAQGFKSVASQVDASVDTIATFD